MAGENFHDLIGFLTVAREQNFTRAAAKLGVSQSALSHTVRALEERLGLRLLTRTTRSVAPTEAGERLLRTVGPRFEEIDAELAALSELREKPAGTIRITAHEHAAETVLWPALTRLLPDYPDIKVEIVIDYGLLHRWLRRRRAPRRAGGEGHDCGTHRAGPAHGGGRDAVLLRNSKPLADAAGPDHPRLHKPTPADLWRPLCLGVRESPSTGEGARRGPVGVQHHRPDADRGTGRVRPGVPDRGPGATAHRRREPGSRARRLVPALFRPSPAGHPSRRQQTPAFALLVDALRYRGASSAIGTPKRR